MGDKMFSQKSAVVTGAGRGIGRALALGLASAGADLALLARSQPELDEVAEHSRALGARVVVVPTDLADQSAVAAAIAYIQKECGAIDILINNAAVVQPMGPTVDVDVAEWAAAITVNLVRPGPADAGPFARHAQAKVGPDRERDGPIGAGAVATHRR